MHGNSLAASLVAVSDPLSMTCPAAVVTSCNARRAEKINNGIPRGARTQENGAEALTVGVNWYLNKRVRTMFNWSEYWYDNSLGTPLSCRQTVCSGGNPPLRRSHDPVWELSTRLQLWF